MPIIQDYVSHVPIIIIYIKDNVTHYVLYQDILKINHQANVNRVHFHVQFVDSLLRHVLHVHRNIIY